MLVYSTILSENPISKKDIDVIFENFETVFSLYVTSQDNLKYAARSLAYHIIAFFLCKNKK